MLRRVALLAGAVVMAWVLAGCGSRPLVGILLPSTGPASSYGESIESGIRLAIIDCREQGLLPSGFEAVWGDTASNPEQAVEELERMVAERGLEFVIGGATSSEAQALIPALDELEVVCLSPSASAPGLGHESKFFFRIYPSDELEGHTAAKFLHDRMGKNEVVLYAGDDQYTAGIEPEFRKQFVEALGGRVIARIDLSELDWRSESVAELGSRSDVGAYVIGYAEQILEVLRQLREQGYGERVVTTSAFYTSRVIHEAGELAEGVLLPLPPFDRTSDKEPVVGFVNRYMDTYQRAPDVFAAHGYDAMRVAVEVLRFANPAVATEIRRALLFGITDYVGVTGPILFDDHGDVKHYPKMFIVKDGQILSYERYLETERARILREVQDLLTDRD